MNEQNESEQSAPPSIYRLHSRNHFLRGRWDMFILPAASILTVLSGPGNYLISRLHSAPAGLLAVIGSFVLFALGAGAALTKHRWHRNSA
jgi:hypothetical protein